VPQRRQVFTEGQYLLAIGVRNRDRLFSAPHIVFLLDLLGAAQFVFPDPLERTCNETVFGLHSIILPPRALGIVSCPLALQ
jgi:hypothetical protein